MILSVKLLTKYVITVYALGSIHEKFGVKIPGGARRKELLSRSKLKQSFLIDSDVELFS